MALQGGPGPVRYQQGRIHQSGTNPMQYQQMGYPGQYGPPQPIPSTAVGAAYGVRPYAPPPGPPDGYYPPPPTGSHNPSTQYTSGYGAPPMNQGPDYGPPQGQGGPFSYQEYSQPPPQYMQPPYQQYDAPPQSSGDGAFGKWGAMAAGGLAGLAGGVFLAEEAGNIGEDIEDGVEDVQGFFNI